MLMGYFPFLIQFLETLIDKKTRSFIPEMFVNISATFVDEQMLCGKSLGVLDQCCRLFEIVGLPPPTAGVELNEYLYKAFFRAAVVILRDFRSKLPQNNSSNNFAQIVYDNLGVLDAVWLFIHAADFYLLETFWDVAMMLVEVYEADAEGLVVAMWCQALEWRLTRRKMKTEMMIWNGGNYLGSAKGGSSVMGTAYLMPMIHVLGAKTYLGQRWATSRRHGSMGRNSSVLGCFRVQR